jgi:biopolymer transport protein ExbD
MELKLKTRFQYRSIMDMTPLIDFAFSLLIYFMMTYNADAGKLSSIIVNLPNAVKAEDAKISDLVVSINEKNEIYINDNKYKEDMLVSEFVKMKSKFKLRTVIIRGDKKTNYDTIIKVMDSLNQAGISKFTLATIKS